MFLFCLMEGWGWNIIHHYIENEEEHDEQEGQLPQLPHRERQRRCYSGTDAHLAQKIRRPQRKIRETLGKILSDSQRGKSAYKSN